MRRVGEAARGFTLIEILVVIIVLGLLAALVGPRILGRVSEAKSATARTQIELLGLALDNYRLDSGAYPTTAPAADALRTSNAQLPSGDTMSVTGAARNGSRRPAASVPSSGFAPPSRRHWPVGSIVRWRTSPRRAAVSRALATRSLRVAACW